MNDLYQEKLKQVSQPRAWFVVVITASFFFFEFGLITIFNSIGHLISQTYGISDITLGIINSLYFYTNILFLIPAGYICDRFSTKIAIVVALSISCLGLLVISLTETLFLLVLARFMKGLAGSFSLVACLRIATSWFHSKKLGLVIGVVIAIGMFGGFAAQKPVAYLLHEFGWHRTLFSITFIGLIFIVLILLFVRSAPFNVRELRNKQKFQLKQKGNFFEIALMVLKKPQNWFCALYVGFINCPTFMLGSAWANKFLIKKGGPTINHLEAATITGYLFIGMILAYPFWGQFSDWIRSRKKPLILGSLISLITIIFIIYSEVGMIRTSLLFFILGFALSTQTVAYPLIGELNPMKYNSTATSLVSMMSLLWGGVITIPLYPMLVQLYLKIKPNALNYEPYQFAMGILIVIFVASLIFSLLLKETHCVRQYHEY
jgi:MFS family permease